MNERWLVQKRLSKNVLTHLLELRGIGDAVKAQAFLQPNFIRDLHDPFLMRGMDSVVARIKEALKKKEQIGIFGDYDADGVCGSAILYSVFERMKIKPVVETYLPDRQKEGFGLSIPGISYFIKRKVTLVITVDCGITNQKEILWAKEKGIDVIVTDHHELSQGPPPSGVFLDPKRPDETYPFRDLCGAGVAFKLAQALKASLHAKDLSEAWEKRLLDLVAIATVADMVPLLGENRALVKYGLLVIPQTHRLGLKALLREAGLEGRPLSSHDVAFSLAPRINATSRIDHAVKALGLFIAKRRSEAAILARAIEHVNKRRRSVVEKILRQVIARAKKHEEDIKRHHLVFESDPLWAPGILSLVSNRLKDQYLFPAIVVSKGKPFAIASCRAHPPFSLVGAMEKINAQDPSLFVRWGGHHQAAGFTVKSKDLKKVKQAWESITAPLAFSQAPQPLEIACELQAPEITLDLWENIQKLEPFGQANPKPTFLLRNATITNVRKVGSKEAHFKLVLEKEGHAFEAIYFNGSKHHDLSGGQHIDVAFTLEVSYWSVHTKAELHVLDLSPAS